ncbi:MAG: elongation factor G [Bdellovibrionota bacterium]
MVNNFELKDVRNFGISAHIDSGKTTLTERILFYTGRIHAIHEVRGKDGVGAKMDSMDLEREKGITIQSAATYTTWKENQINIIDTPGHVDFTIEVERSLRVLDGAILILCGKSGVQAQSITVDRQMKRYGVPRVAFINKLDRSGADPEKVISQLRDKLNLNAVAIQMNMGTEDAFEGLIDLVEERAVYFDGEDGEKVRYEEIPAEYKEKAAEWRQNLIGACADFDDEVGEKFLMEEEISKEEIMRAIRKGVISLQFVPVFMGSAFKNKGVQELLDGVGHYLPSPLDVANLGYDQDQDEKEFEVPSDPEKPFIGLAFKLEDGRYGQLTYVRVYQGTVKKGDFIFNTSAGNKKVKVPRIVQMHSDEMEDIEEAKAGDIVAFFGIDCASGDTFTDGKANVTMSSIHIPPAVISLAIEPKDKGGQANFSKALSKFRKEDPTFRVHRDEESGQTIISGMGELHLEVYVERMKREFKCEVDVGQPQVAYRETIQAKADYDYTHKKQTGGSGQFAKVVGYIEPLPADSEKEFEFENNIVGGKIPREYIPAVEKGFQEQFARGGLIGYPIVGVKVELHDGSYHDVDSSEMAFRICAMAAARESFKAASPIALEPIMGVEVSGPEEFQGNMMGLLNQRRGIIEGTTSDGGDCTISAAVPLTEMFGFSTDLRSGTQGKGEFTMEFAKYAQVPGNIQKELVKEYEKKKEEEKK